MWVRGLKHSDFVVPSVDLRSHPMWVRGLKHILYLFISEVYKSHPMWVRGLKPTQASIDAQYMRRTLCGCVD